MSSHLIQNKSLSPYTGQGPTQSASYLLRSHYFFDITAFLSPLPIAPARLVTLLFQEHIGHAPVSEPLWFHSACLEHSSTGHLLGALLHLLRSLLKRHLLCEAFMAFLFKIDFFSTVFFLFYFCLLIFCFLHYNVSCIRAGFLFIYWVPTTVSGTQ